MQVLELWAVKIKAFDKLLDKFKAEATRPRAKGGRIKSTKNIDMKD